MITTVKSQPKFIAEVSSNHNRDIERCFNFIETAAAVGCDAVKFQLFKIDQLFAPEILSKSKIHRDRKQWELPIEFLPELKKSCEANKIEFSCTPFYLSAVEILAEYASFLKIASYELLWNDLLIECALTGLPIVLSTGMASLEEIDTAVAVLLKHNAKNITLLHCVSAYPTPLKDCNLAVLGEYRTRYGVKVGWSDHSVSKAVLNRAIHHWNADVIEFHLDLDGQGEEYTQGHCWLPEQINNVISDAKDNSLIDGNSVKETAMSEQNDRDWRADPIDGLRPLYNIRKSFGE